MTNDRPATSTLLSAERALRPFVLSALGVSLTATVVLLIWSFPRAHLLVWLACALPALVLHASNLRYVCTHELPTVGLLPICAWALGLACVACLTVPVTSLPARLALAAMALCAGCLLVVFLPWFWRLWRTASSRPVIASDAALLVLGAAIREGRPGATLADRLGVAARLWCEEPTRLIVVSGGPTPDGDTTEADVMAAFLEQAGVAPDSILRERQARNTRENLALSARLLDSMGWTGQRCVVSSGYHLWRALCDARQAGADFVPVAAPTPQHSWLQQWCREVLTILFLRLRG